MYESFYGFSKKPFQLVPNPEFLYLSPQHQNALTYLEYGMKERAGFILLTGEIGTGKTTLIRHLLNKIETEMDIAVIFNTNVNASQLLQLILQEFELEPAGDDKTKNLDILYNFLIDRYAQKKQVILIIDEAQNLGHDELEETRMLSNLHTDDSPLLQIMLVGQPELKAKLEDPSLAQLRQRIVVNYHLVSLTREEMEIYIESRLTKAGGPAELFIPAALDEIFELTGGTPRAINLICDMALVYGYADGRLHIDQETIQQVIKDRGDLIPRRETGEQPLVESEKETNISQRLTMLETAVQQLQQQKPSFEIASQELTTIRKRHEKLLLAYGRLKQKYDILERHFMMKQQKKGD